MKTPDSPTKTSIERQGPVAPGTLQRWGTEPVRVVVEAAPAASPVRARLREQAAQDYPQGKVLERLRYFGMQRGLPAPADPSLATARERGTPAARKLARGVAAAKPSSTPVAFKAAAQLPAWRELGPALIPHGQTYGSGAGAKPAVSGRCSGITIDRSDSRHLVLCSASGGLWGSRDAGATWVPLTDQQPTLVMGAIAQSASAPNVMYAGTGDGDGQIPYGLGLLRSTDAGQTWALAPSAGLTGVGVYDLAVDPADPLRVWVGSTAALHFSADGGTTLRTAMVGVCWSVSVNPASPTELFAATEGGLMRSANGGSSWARVTLPGTTAATRFSRLEVCHAPSQPAVVYVAGCTGNRAALWRRTALGGAFAAEAVPSAMNISQAWYDWCLAVAPHDATLVYWGAIDLYRGKRGASAFAWTNISSRSNGDSIHPDQHFVGFDPADPRVVYSCNDGGLFRSPDGGDHWLSLNPGLGITEFEYLAQLESQPAWLMGGTQDNGTLTNASAQHWDQIALGDGGDCASIDRAAASICYHSYYDMPVERAPALGAQAFSWTDVSPPTPRSYAALFYPPLEARASVLAKAGATVWVSADEGAHWDEVALPTSADADPDLATALAIPSDGLIIVGTLAGRMYRISRGAAGWSGASVASLGALGTGYVSDIAVVGNGTRTIWASCSQVGGPHVFRSLNGGKTWTSRTGNLPDIAVNALVVDPKNTSVVYAATDAGVWRTRNSGGAWSDFSNGLPNAIVGDLLLHAASRVLRAGTRARGAWEVSV
ncbi:WD40/YVTN/BNR-like repeat-containing protein [Piscinibacter sp.]|jgi:photosystem II stability/assembly factor-like uncharacterized protein|uniref:WD40/YVTN/BNR-like repeat-containing protein n=1 Tax=Piscinibacter sp. TaxID=1903157 RepID=UPI0035593EC3